MIWNWSEAPQEKKIRKRTKSERNKSGKRRKAIN
jgi:hypothetical protein